MPVRTRRIYLDFNASTPVAPEVIAAMTGVLEEPYGNPSSDHWAGKPAREAVDKARMQVAGLLGCRHDEIVFTSGGSEANNHALKGVFFASGRADRYHPSGTSGSYQSLSVPRTACCDGDLPAS